MMASATNCLVKRRAISRRTAGIRGAVLFLALLAAPFAFAAPANDGPNITYRKTFKSSYPEFVEIKRWNNSAAYLFRRAKADRK